MVSAPAALVDPGSPPDARPRRASDASSPLSSHAPSSTAVGRASTDASRSPHTAHDALLLSTNALATHVVDGSIPRSAPRHARAYLIYACVTAAFGMVHYGYGLGQLNNVSSVLVCTPATVGTGAHSVLFGATTRLPACLPMTTLQLSFANAILALTGAVGAVAAGATSDRCGRRTTLRMLMVPLAVGSAVLFAAPSFVWVMVGRAVTGIGTGGALAISPMFVSELAPTEMRGVMGNLSAAGVAVGLALASLLGYFLATPAAWRYVVGFPLVLAVAQFIMLLGVPESPAFLALRGRQAKADRVLVSLGSLPAISEPFGGHAHPPAHQRPSSALSAPALDGGSAVDRRLMYSTRTQSAQALIDAPLGVPHGVLRPPSIHVADSSPSPRISDDSSGSHNSGTVVASSADSDLGKRAGALHVPDARGGHYHLGAGIATRRLRLREFLTRPEYRRALLVLLLAHASSQLSGINSLFAYSMIILTQVMPPDKASLFYLVFAFVNIPINQAPGYFVDKYGRRPLLLLSMLGMGTLYAAFTIVIAFHAPPFVSMVLFVLISTFFAVGLSNVPIILTAELVPPAAVACASQAALAVNSLANFTVLFAFPPLLEHLREYTFLIFAAYLALAAAVLAKWMPETKGKPPHVVAAELNAALADRVADTGESHETLADMDAEAISTDW
ncbi:hypothetical protein AMAG_11722 [Allomyces macrogynus ATCC 38327]|uniref:Major facilitator superfamily (MFS) profile domain-containing protein n=1 Tax=Allomyces macrogynus (strain ATCC 38327) TaxID=578462 RepID=A0A0L0SW90_ALLM3|nr:hypothetical protein AMAG_11722 [Allomyces macrogynus ATCC 38327]|eukprot:KNE66604.1 hypothetical protein AMAG_11722 [Allomyces macrogynus ATCC 38327]